MIVAAQALSIEQVNDTLFSRYGNERPSMEVDLDPTALTLCQCLGRIRRLDDPAAIRSSR
jgi:hypothetical protein